MSDSSALDEVITLCRNLAQPSRSFDRDGRQRDAIAANTALTVLALIGAHRNDIEEDAAFEESCHWIIQSQLTCEEPWKSYGEPYTEDEISDALHKLDEKRKRYPTYRHRLALVTNSTRITPVDDRTYADKINEPLRPETIQALNDRIASGQAPVRQVPRRTDPTP